MFSIKNKSSIDSNKSDVKSSKNKIHPLLLTSSISTSISTRSISIESNKPLFKTNKSKNKYVLQISKASDCIEGVKLYLLYESFNHLVIVPSTHSYYNGVYSKWSKLLVYLQNINLWIWIIKCQISYWYPTYLANYLFANPFKLFNKGGEIGLILSGYSLIFNIHGK